MLRKGILSNKDINRLLGKEIFIYPFNESNLKGSTYNLTASPCAYILEEDGGKKRQKIIVNRYNEIVIPPHKTALIETVESIYVSNKICGTYHSKVGVVKKGLSHIGTTLDPEYFGTSLIAVHNITDCDESIKVGQTFASIMFSGMRSKSNATHDNHPFRSDLIDINVVDFYDKNWSEEDEKDTETVKESKTKAQVLEEINEWKNAGYRTSQKCLQNEVQIYVKRRDRVKTIWWTIGVGVFISIIIEILLIAWVKNIVYIDNEGLVLGLVAMIATVIPTASIVINMRVKYINNKYQ